ncbi:2-keto-3-deoxygluconate kinase [Arthrobacter sp. MYb229]|uniref:sugar kinase n=1 Tax=unclassified Arthrobacter TaxID=235627 RepID=UPI000CFC8D61|nr:MULTISPECIES: sugar kinase [unclassified Arthrobacter]PRA03006.1 2-keto-3-deoxygluconate kinase [Arthrobacter sp. MYb229]PRB49476.1 2-keto-3-deoxygluconate kinase [Arthrobacter sp. MYb216]
MSDVICLGETMAMVTPANGSALHHAHEMALAMGGAESNVALGLAAMGVDVSWVSRVGADDFGSRITEELNAGGVDTSLVESDDRRPTGLYVKAPAHDRSPAKVLYYRAGSAASAMDRAFLRHPSRATALRAVKLIHLSGITAALSDSCAEMMLELCSAPRQARICFDVNWRSQLWQGRDASLLQKLANKADVVMVGLDEAELAFGTSDEQRIRQLLPDPSILVLKNESTSAIALTPEGRFEVPSLQVDVIEPVGAGDSFAAGFLSGLLAGLTTHRALRRGHLAAACTLTVRADRGDLPPAEVISHLLQLQESQWSGTVLSAEGISVFGEQIYRKGIS